MAYQRLSCLFQHSQSILHTGHSVLLQVNLLHVLHSLHILPGGKEHSIAGNTEWLELHLFSLYLQCLDVALDALNCLLSSLKHILSVHLVLSHLPSVKREGERGRGWEPMHTL